MRVRLSKSKIIKIINLYRENECLWNLNSPLHKLLSLRKRVLKNIGKQLGITAEEAKDKIKNLRNTYVAERKKELEFRNAGNGPEVKFHTGLFWYDKMAFLNKTIASQKGTINVEEPLQENMITLDELSQPSESSPPKSTEPVASQCQSFAPQTPMPLLQKRMIMVEAPKLDPERFTYSIVLPSMNELPSSPPKNNPIEENPLKRSKQLARDSREKSFKELRGICEALNKTPPEENEFDCFGRSIACHLKKLPESLALESMGHIQSYLVEQRLRSIEEQ